MVSKTCNTCGIDKPVKDFHVKRKGRTDPYQAKCKLCVKDAQLLQKYGITLGEYNEWFYTQRGSCAICGVHQNELDRSLAVDHDHETGEVRGLLCPNCNVGIGHFRDDVELLMEAINYLNET